MNARTRNHGTNRALAALVAPWPFSCFTAGMTHVTTSGPLWGLGLNDIERQRIEEALGDRMRIWNGEIPALDDPDGQEPFLLWVAGRAWQDMSLARRREILAWDAPQKVLVLARDDETPGLDEAMDAGFLSVIRAPLSPEKCIHVMDRAREVHGVYDDIMRMTREISLEREILARKTDYLLFLNRVMARAVESLNPATILSHAREDINFLLPVAAAQGVFWQRTGDGSLEAELFLTFQEDVDAQEQWTSLLLDNAAARAGQRVAGYQMTYIMETPDNGALPDLAPNAKRTLVLPLKAGGEEFGCLVLLLARPARLSREQNQILLLACNHLGLALKNALLFREAKIRADYDGLTRINNRQSFDLRLMEELKRQQRYGHDLSLMIFDLDHFKNINDTFGHQAGDQVLREVGKLLSDCLRETDFAARYGGEEFAVILPHTPHGQAFNLADRLRARVAELGFESEGRAFQVTVSIGVASTTQEAPQRTTDLLRRADQALYRAKHLGRDRVCAADHECVGQALAQGSV